MKRNIITESLKLLIKQIDNHPSKIYDQIDDITFENITIEDEFIFNSIQRELVKISLAANKINLSLSLFLN